MKIGSLRRKNLETGTRASHLSPTFSSEYNILTIFRVLIIFFITIKFTTTNNMGFNNLQRKYEKFGNF